MRARLPAGRTWPLVLSGVVWTLLATAAVVVVAIERQLADSAAHALALGPGVLAVYLAAVLSAGVVGTVLVVRRAHPVGAAFLVLAASLALNAAADLYARSGAVAWPESRPGAAAVAHLVDPAFVVFFASVAVALHLTPTGRPLSAWWAGAGATTVAAAALAYLGGVASDEAIDPPFEALANPLAVPALGPVPSVMRAVGANVTALGLLVSAASLVVRFRRSDGADRQQLLWLTFAVLPLPVFVGVVFAFRDSDNQLPQLLATGGWIVVVPVVTGLCISRYHLFDVDRILSRTLTYVLLTAAVVLTYAVVVVVSSEILSGQTGSSTISAIVATFAAVTIAAPTRRRLQAVLDRRFNRRRFDALRIIEAHLRNLGGGENIEEVLRRALMDPDLRVAYWVEDRRQWVASSGRAADPAPDAVHVRRGGLPVAALSPDATGTPRHLTEAVGALAVSELDNARLRAAVSLKLVEVEESRARIAAAQLAERRRIERNLHDGAQQRLLALGFELRAAELNGDPTRLRAAVAMGIEQAHAALVELRDLANGLQPAVLSDGGLTAALDDLRGRTAGVLEVTCTPHRFTADLEAAAWFVISEAVANACKHAQPTAVAVEVATDHRWLTAVIRDDGQGGADPAGSGIQGMQDRAEAAAGTLELTSLPGSGTTVRARFPCAP